MEAKIMDDETFRELRAQAVDVTLGNFTIEDSNALSRGL